MKRFPGVNGNLSKKKVPVRRGTKLSHLRVFVTRKRATVEKEVGKKRSAETYETAQKRTYKCSNQTPRRAKWLEYKKRRKSGGSLLPWWGQVRWEGEEVPVSPQIQKKFKSQHSEHMPLQPRVVNNLR